MPVLHHTINIESFFDYVCFIPLSDNAVRRSRLHRIVISTKVYVALTTCIECYYEVNRGFKASKARKIIQTAITLDKITLSENDNIFSVLEKNSSRYDRIESLQLIIMDSDSSTGIVVPNHDMLELEGECVHHELRPHLLIDPSASWFLLRFIV